MSSSRAENSTQRAASKLREAEKEVRDTSKDVYHKMKEAREDLHDAHRDVEGSSREHVHLKGSDKWRSEEDRIYFEKVERLRHPERYEAPKDVVYEKPATATDPHMRRDQRRAREFDEEVHETTEQIKESARDTVEYIGDKAEKAADKTKEAAFSLKDKLSRAGDYVAEKLHGAKETTKDAAKRVGTDLSQPVTAAKAHIMDAKDKISEKTQELERDFHETVEQRRAREAREEALRKARLAQAPTPIAKTSTTTTTYADPAAARARAAAKAYRSEVVVAGDYRDPALVRNQTRPAERCSNFDVQVDCERAYTFTELRDMLHACAGMTEDQTHPFTKADMCLAMKKFAEEGR